MSSKRSIRRVVLGFLLAWAVGAILGSVVQTQFNLLALQNLGVEVSMTARLFATGHDLLHFVPLYAVVFGAGFLLSQAGAAGFMRLTGVGVRGPVYALAAAFGLWVTFTVVDALAPVLTLIAATRTPDGLIAMMLTAAFSGWLFAWLTASRPKSAEGYVAGSALVLCLVVGLAWPTGPARAQSATGYSVETVTDGLVHPWSLVFLPEGGALVTERAGRLRKLSEEGQLLPAPVSGVPAVFNSRQAGLFEVVLSPAFVRDRLVYLSYACGTLDANNLCVARGRLESNSLTDVTEIFRARPARQGSAHYGGRMVWLPDGTLIVTLGDGFDYREQAQILSNHIGTIVRLNADGTVPADNPFVGQEGVLPEIYSYGHRNVQGLVFDPVENLLIIHEHGPRGGDEINLVEPGNNYGWPVITDGIDYTGAMVTPYTEYEGMQQPLLHWTPSIAPSGMTRYRGDLFPGWRGDLFVGALADRSVHRVRLEGRQATDVETLFSELDERIRDVVTGPDGALYLLTDSPEGRLLRVHPE